MGWVVDGTPELDAQSDYKTVLTVAIVSTVLMVLTLGMRLFVRRSRLGWDDYIVVFGAICGVIYNAFAIMQTKYGLGLRKDLRPTSDLTRYTLYNYACRPFLWTNLTCFKIALCITYLRMMDRTSHKRYRLVVYVFMALLVAIAIFGLAFNVFNCIPMEKNLHPEVPGTCLEYGPWNLGTWTVNIVLDIMIFLLPIPLFMNLKINFSVRLEVSILFGLSVITTAVSIWKLSQVPRIAWGDGNSTQFVYLSCLEANIGIIVSCLPHLKPLYNWGKAQTSKSRSRSGTNTQGYRLSKMSKLGSTLRQSTLRHSTLRHSTMRHSTVMDQPTDSLEGLRSESQDQILNSGITKTTSIVVDHETFTMHSPASEWK